MDEERGVQGRATFVDGRKTNGLELGEVSELVRWGGHVFLLVDVGSGRYEGPAVAIAPGGHLVPAQESHRGKPTRNRIDQVPSARQTSKRRTVDSLLAGAREGPKRASWAVVGGSGE